MTQTVCWWCCDITNAMTFNQRLIPWQWYYQAMGPLWFFRSSIFDEVWLMFFFDVQLCLLLCHLFCEKIFFSGQYQVRLHSNCVYSKIGLFLEALKQQRRMSITIQSITSLIRNGPSLWCISKPVHICSPGVCKVLLRHLYHDPLYHSHQMHIFWNR